MVGDVPEYEYKTLVKMHPVKLQALVAMIDKTINRVMAAYTTTPNYLQGYAPNKQKHQFSNPNIPYPQKHQLEALIAYKQQVLYVIEAEKSLQEFWGSQNR